MLSKPSRKSHTGRTYLPARNVQLNQQLVQVTSSQYSQQKVGNDVRSSFKRDNNTVASRERTSQMQLDD
jgi:hypothetical protein